ncbi:MAG: OsmC family protein [Bacteroidales bacterium]|nr:OsmC family protein [Bacteroidales bacterium]
MAKHQIITEWKGDMAFESNIDGHIVRMDAPVESGGHNSGSSPKKLMLSALSGCTGMDVVSILKKMRVNIEKCLISVDADVTEEHPKQYESMHLIYEFHGKDLPLEKLQKAVRMSEEMYCGVGAFYRKVVKITSEIQVVDTK